jgi:hypothetical protein
VTFSVDVVLLRGDAESDASARPARPNAAMCFAKRDGCNRFFVLVDEKNPSTLNFIFDEP